MDSTRNYQVIHPSFWILAGPLVPAAAFFLGGAYRGELQLRQSVPALLLLISTYLLSRWFRRSFISIDNETITVGERTVRLEDISAVEPVPLPVALPGPDRLAVYDRNRVHRLTLIPAAYGGRLREALGARNAAPKLPEPSASDRAVASVFAAICIVCLVFALLGVL